MVCGINAFSSQWCGCIFILCYTHLKLALLLHKQGLVATGVATTISIYILSQKLNGTFQYLGVLIGGQIIPKSNSNLKINPALTEF